MSLDGYSDVPRYTGRGAAGASAFGVSDEGDSRGLFFQTLDVLNRPFSAVHGGITGAVRDDLGVVEGFWEGLRGVHEYGGLEVLEGLGFDPENPVVRYGATGYDVLSPLDPLNYVGIGQFSKAAKVARKLPGGSVNLEKALVSSRRKAAESGHYGLLALGGKVVPLPGVNRAIATAADMTGEALGRSSLYRFLDEHLGGVRKRAERDPDTRELLEFLLDGEKAMVLSGRERIRKIAAIADRLVAQAGSGKEAMRIRHAVTDLIERPADAVERLKRRQLGIEAELASGGIERWTPGEGLSPVETTLIRETTVADLGAVKERRLGLRAGQASPTPGLDAETEGFILDSVINAREAGDLPPRRTLHQLRANTIAQRVAAEKNPSEATAELQAAADLILPIFQDAEKIYLERMRKYDPGARMSMEFYVPHMFPRQFGALQRLRHKQSRKAALTKELAEEKGLKGAALEIEVNRTLRAEGGAVGGSQDAEPILSGLHDGFRRRRIPKTTGEVYEAYQAGEIGFAFERDSLLLADEAARRAERFAFGHDLHEFATQKGLTIDAEAFAELDVVEQARFVPMRFQLPGIDPKKQPFLGKYMERDAYDLLQAQLGTMKRFTTEDGMNALLQAAHGFRRVWSAWTLMPFPAFHARNLAGDMMLSYQGGLNPVTDMAKLPTGGSAYGASMELARRMRKVRGDLDPAFRQAQGSLQGRIDAFNAKFPEAKLTEEALIARMQSERIVGENMIRDVDIQAAISDDPAIRRALNERRKLRSVVNPRPTQNLLVQWGQAGGQFLQDFTRGALYLDSLERVLPDAKTADDAFTFAAVNTRRFLADYSDLTNFERNYLKLAIPFYTWMRHNIPLQVTQALGEPGRIAWANRLYQSTWNNVADEDELAPEDLPEWLESQMGLPLRKLKDKDGVEAYSVWSPRGWIPSTELAEMAHVARDGGLRQFMLGAMNPMFTQPFEQLLGVDSFTGKDLTDGQLAEMFGFPIPQSAANLIKDWRIVTTIDNLDPGGAWTKLGHTFGWFTGERPHRRQPPEAERWTRVLTGFNTKEVVPQEEHVRRVQRSQREMNDAKMRARYATRSGFTKEAEKFERKQAEQLDAIRESLERLNQLRRVKALGA